MKKKLARLIGSLMVLTGATRWLSAPPLEFSFDPQTGLSGRVVTPNNDNANDLIHFSYCNPLGSLVELTVFDVTGAIIHRTTTTDAVCVNSLTWDGRGSSGIAVPSGIYIYQIVSEGRVFNGTIVVAR